MPRELAESSQNEAPQAAAFQEFRRKIKQAEVLSGSTQRLLTSMNFTGKVSVVIQNGRILKCGYEEGYFRQS